MKSQHDQDRDRIAEAIREQHNHAETHCPIPPTIDAAIKAFETLCEPRGWSLWRAPRGEYDDAITWYAVNPKRIEAAHFAPTGSHAADVCRLVCEVLDREAKGGR
jgi:hypothetical protein